MATRKIGGREVVLEPIAPMLSFSLQPLIAPAAGRIVGLILKELGSEEGVSIDTLTIGDLMARAPRVATELGDAFGCIKPEDSIRVLRGLLAQATCDGIPLFPVAGSDKVFDGLFRGRTRDLWEILWFGIQVNYPDFLPARVGSVATSPVAGPSATSNVTNPSGQS